MCDGGAAPADGDEGDVALIGTRDFGIVGQLAIEAEPIRTWPLRSCQIRRSGGPRRADCHGEDWRLRRKKPGFLHLAKQVGIGQEGILGQDVEVGEESEGFVEMESSLWRWRSLSRSLRTSKLSTASAAKSCASRDSLRRGSCDQSRTA
jgi:hypothetical protein